MPLQLSFFQNKKIRIFNKRTIKHPGRCIKKFADFVIRLKKSPISKKIKWKAQKRNCSDNWG